MQRFFDLWIVGASFCIVMALSVYSPNAEAFCGLYVNGTGGKLYNDATQVVLMRKGTTTVVSMRNTYRGPLKDFAMVVPVPRVLTKDHVKVLKDRVFDKIDTLSAPRLVKYWQRQKCYGKRKKLDLGKGDLFGGGFGESKSVKVVSSFTKGEYDIVVLSAKDSNGLQAWLKINKYNIPKGASKTLQSYIQQGMYFFVAKVNIKRVKPTWVRGKSEYLLSPLRFHYESDAFSLPVRLGLVNSSGKQDLIVHILARKERYEVANMKNVTIPTNLIVKEKVAKTFGAFYAALFDYTIKKNPGAAVTEYAWESSKCDPCPNGVSGANASGPLGSDDLYAFGLDAFHPSKHLYYAKAKEETVVSSGKWPKRIPILRRRLSTLAKRCSDQQVQTVKMQQTVIDLSLAPGASASFTIKGGTPTFRACLTKGLTRINKHIVKRIGVTESISLVSNISYKRYTRILNPIEQQVGWVLTRLHLRYSPKTLKNDLVFKVASPITGGTGAPDANGKFAQKGTSPGRSNQFQARYMILKWMSKSEKAKALKQSLNKSRRCSETYWGRPPATPNSSAMAARELPFVKKKMKLSSAIVSKNQPGLPWYRKKKLKKK